MTAAFLQARMGSTRLPGKVLLPIHGKSLLERAVERLRAAATIDRIVVLTTRLESDYPVIEEARRLGVDVFLGPELDVLARFTQAAEEFEPAVVVRATADNPLIDVGAIDRVVAAMRARRLDYCIETGLPVGTTSEAITRAALAAVDERAREPRHREHVTLYVKERPEEFRAAFLRAPQRLCSPELRLTVDTPEDLAFVEALIRRMPEGDRPVPLASYLPLAAQFPSR